MPVGAPKYNLNAEVWTLEEAEKLFNDALDLTKNNEYDFIGEVARDLGTYREIFKYLSKKYTELNSTYKLILSNLEANCFSHTKKGKINTAVGIVNLKSNYGWTDRVENKNENTNINSKELTPDEIKALNEELDKTY